MRYAVIIGYVEADEEEAAAVEGAKGARKMLGRRRYRRHRDDVHLMRVRTPVRAAAVAQAAKR